MNVSDLRLWRAPGLDGVDLLRASRCDTRYARHFHDGYAVGALVEGALGFRYLGRDCMARAGEVNMVAPGEVHDGWPGTPQGWSYRMFYLEPRAVAAVAAQLGGKPGQLPDFGAGVLRDPELAAALCALHRDLDQGQTTLLERQSRLVNVLGAWIARHADGRRDRLPRREPGAVRAVKDILRERFAESVPLEELAQATGLSGFHLNRVFRQSVGLAPHEYQVQLRVNRARALLERGEIAAQAALDSGFADQSHLNRHFRRILGLTPGAYRKIVQDR
ncbi:AraC family transcriptional regulator [Fundidesulfovibrio agrisoli]|uniref:AraC family transcriptional regulator n=1 Tax=Fundidesulfovibrio agrisoli TaxID=2922717 RepID=UPI001FAD8D70|nr:AraC family transcriptional regulator [Fundidesulfovibrio agrisoli]